MFSISADRNSRGASKNPAKAYSATTSATAAEMRKAFVLVICSTGTRRSRPPTSGS